MVRPERFERPTYWFVAEGANHSTVQLSATSRSNTFIACISGFETSIFRNYAVAYWEWNLAGNGGFFSHTSCAASRFTCILIEM